MDSWFGTKEIEMISHGEWADPELMVGEMVANYYDIEDYCIGCMKDEDLDYNNDFIFGEWVRSHEEEICDVIHEMSAN